MCVKVQVKKNIYIDVINFISLYTYYGIDGKPLFVAINTI